MRTGGFALLLVMTSAVPAAGQSTSRAYVQGLAGVATVAETDAAVGGGAAIRARDRLDVYFELGRLNNAIWNELRDELGGAEEGIRRQIEAMFGATTPVTFSARVPAWYGLGGARVRGPRAGPLETYLEGGVGMARLRPRVELDIGGERLDAEAGRLLSLEDARAELLTAAGGGVSLTLAGRIRAEGGYRYSRVHGDLPLNIHRVHAGVGYAF